MCDPFAHGWLDWHGPSGKARHGVALKKSIPRWFRRFLFDRSPRHVHFPTLSIPADTNDTMPSWCPFPPRPSSASRSSVDNNISRPDVHPMNERLIMSNNAPMLSPGSMGPRPDVDQGKIKREMLQCQSTPEGDVRTFVADPSFDADERQAGPRSVDSRGSREGTRDDSKPSPDDPVKVAPNNADGATMPAELRQSQHLSAHFNDATKIYDDSAPGVSAEVSENDRTSTAEAQAHIPAPLPDQTNFQQGGANTGTAQQTGVIDAPAEAAVSGGRQTEDLQRRSPVAFDAVNTDGVCDTPSTELMKTELLPSPSSSQLLAAQLTSPALKRSPGVGQKHRRNLSSGYANPNVAHRRMNSGGNAAPVDRGESSYQYQETRKHSRGPIPQVSSQMPPPMAVNEVKASHQRENSAGLSIEMLTAAANASKDVLAEAAGAPRRSPRSSPRSYGGRQSSSNPRGPVTYGRGSPSMLQQPQLEKVEADRSNETVRPSTQYQAPPPPPPPPPPQQAVHGSYQHYHSGASQPPPAPPQQQGPPPAPYAHENYQPAQQQYYQPPPPQSGYYPPRTSAAPPPSSTGPPTQLHQPTYYPPPRPSSSAVAPAGPPPPYPVQYAPPPRSFVLEKEEQQHYPSTHSARKPPHSEGGGYYESERTPPPGAPPEGAQPPQAVHGRQMSQASVGSADRIETDETLFTNKDAVPPPAGWNSGAGGTDGAQSYATNDRRQLSHPGSSAPQPPAMHDGRPPPAPAPPVQQPQYYREPDISRGPGPAPATAPAPAPAPVAAPHHQERSAFIQTLTELETSDNFLRQLSASNPSPTYQAAPASAPVQYASPAPEPQAHTGAVQPTAQGEIICREVAQPAPVGTPNHPAQPPGPSGPSRRYMTSGTSKRVRRKCTVGDCPNRVVQGGLCIAHGAKRKLCSHPGCQKNVKKAGLCSTHGPARKKCEHEGCTKVAVQGGVCIAHGARKKLCSVEKCSKQAILGGMCKKHHDQTHGIVSGRGGRRPSNAGIASVGKPSIGVIGGQAKVAPTDGRPGEAKPNHQRGLSIFQDMGAVATIIGEDGLAEAGVPLAPPQAGNGGEGPSASAAVAQDVPQQNSGDCAGAPQPTTRGGGKQGTKRSKGHNRGLSFFTDENIADTIIKNNII